LLNNKKSNEISNHLVYPIFLTSKVNKDVLANIWSIVNKQTPGKLIKTELYLALALIALAQVIIDY
jgi:hypothetical protein